MKRDRVAPRGVTRGGAVHGAGRLQHEAADRRRALARGHFKPGFLKRLAMEHRSGLVHHGDRLWLLINLEIWQRIFVDGVDPSAIYTDHSHPRRKPGDRIYQPALAPALR